MKLSDLFTKVVAALGLCPRSELETMRTERNQYKDALTRNQRELSEIMNELGAPKPVLYTHPTPVTDALGIDPTMIDHPARIFHHARPVDTNDETLPPIVRAITSIVDVCFIGTDAARIFKIDHKKGIICSGDAQDYMLYGKTLGTPTIGFVRTDGVFTLYPQTTNLALIVFEDGHTEQSPHYTVYTQQNSITPGGFRILGTWKDNHYTSAQAAGRFQAIGRTPDPTSQ